MAVSGSGAPLVVPPSYISHLEWVQSDPYVSAFYGRLSRQFKVILYDQHGVGLSDRTRSDFTLEDDVLDLQAVVESQNLSRFALFGISTGGMVSLLYASRNSSRVSGMVLYGSSAGFTPGEHPGFEAALTALIGLVRANWGLGSRAVAGAFFPTGTAADILDSVSRLQQMAATSEVAANLLEHLYDIDLRPLAKRLEVPTLVMHRRDDHNVPFSASKELTKLLPSCRFLPLEGDIHYPAYGDSDAILDAVIDFLEEVTRDRPREEDQAARPASSVGLSQRELQVLRLIAAGRSNRQIAEELVISINTADRHVSNILTKVGASNRAEAASFAVRHGLAE
jgi:pimeloyl-ACP methyl ester carboxylesterase/DNA-binding CsgD family transcriptional regulator